VTVLEELAPVPDPGLSGAKYRHHAEGYDWRSAAAAPLRQGAIALLALRPGDVVVDVGCGTGLNFAAIQARIGPHGRLVGVDPSADMLDRARERSGQHGWRNVSLVHAPAGEARLPQRVDAALFCLVHDVLRSPAALAHVLSHLRPGARVAAAGPKLVSLPVWWGPWLDRLVLAVNRPYVTSSEGLDRPWSHLHGLLPDLTVLADPFDVTYLAWARVDQPAA
jgi:SAM-dependent methyltransferase